MKIVENNGGVTFTVCVVPRASRTEIVGEHYGALKIRLTSPPVDGAANAELVKLLAKTFSVAKRDIEITSGATSKTKRVCVAGVTAAQAEAILKANS